MAAVRAETTPEVLRWAREAAGFTPSDAARTAQTSEANVLEAEAGERQLTLRQARLLAKAYGRPLAVLFMPEPPDEPSVERKFRMLRGAPPPPWGADLLRIEREVRERQAVAVELYASLDETAPWPTTVSELGLRQGVPAPAALREYLGIRPLDMRGSDVWHARRVVVRAVEWAGVLVIRQPIADTGVRGFAVPHETVPAIVVNSGEHPRAHVFSILHELAHLLLDCADVSVRSEEEWCEAYAGEVLMPEAEFRAVLSVGGEPVRAAKRAADEFGVTPLAVAVRARHLDIFSVSDLVAVRDRPFEPPRATGANPNRTKVARLSPTFTDLVLSAAGASALTLSAASRLLRTKVDDFGKLREIASGALTEQ